MGTQLPPKKGAQPQFSAHVYCDQAAGCIRIPLGTEVGLGPGNTALDGDPAPPKRGTAPPPLIFGPHVRCGQTAGWINMPLSMLAGLDPGDIVLDGDPAPLPRKEHSSSPTFRPMSIVARRLDGSRCHLIRKYASAQATLYLMGTQSPERGTAYPHFSAHVYCGQTVAHFSYC